MTPVQAGPEGRRIEKLFSGIAGKYDIANDLLSLGVHRLWKRAAADLCGDVEGLDVLDAATGTGDLARIFASRGAKVVGLDFCAEMLEVAKSKSDAGAALPGARVEWREGDVQSTGLPGASFDRATIAFGLRNVQDPNAGLRELWRLLRPGGKLVVLEFGEWGAEDASIVLRGFGRLARFGIPFVGGALTGEKGAYSYLWSSSSGFPGGARLARELGRLPGAKSSGYKNLWGGIAYMAWAEKS